MKQMQMNKPDYEELEKRGLLFMSPCALGDTVYRIRSHSRNPIVELRVYKVSFQIERGIKIECLERYTAKEYTYTGDDIGKAVFLTTEAAAGALYKLNNESEV